MAKRKLFCEISPLCYKISLQKEYILRDIHDITNRTDFADTYSEKELPCIVKGHRSVIVRQLKGVDLTLQQNKKKNLLLAGSCINGLIIKPNETFSFWKCIGNPSAKKGYIEGLVISGGNVSSGVGGGLCQLANLIHWMILHSPLTVTELHHHSDSIFPDSGRRVPFGTGTSVFYKNVDYRFKNTTDQSVQLLIWQEEGDLCGELRSEHPFEYKYRIIEKDHYFSEEEDGFYRNSKVFKLVMDCEGNILDTELILKNHSKVLYDASLIPLEQIRNNGDII